jgi:flagellar biosynthesis protein FliR
MSLPLLLAMVPVFFLVTLRVAAMMLLVPLFGSARIPRRIKVMFALVASVPLAAAVGPIGPLPDSLPVLTLAVLAELAIGAISGAVVLTTFVAVQWAGEIIGQQVGFNLSEVLDPAFGRGGSVTGEMYFLLALVVFMILGGPGRLFVGLLDSFKLVPPLQVVITADLLEPILKVLAASLMLAVRVAAPLVVAMLISDVAVGCLGKTMPQFNILSSGLNLRAVLGLILLAVTVGLVPGVLQVGLEVGLRDWHSLWTTLTPAGATR